MIHGGYILQPRCFDESDSSKFPPVTRELWFYLLRKVNHRDSGKFKRGQGFFCLSDIQDDLSWYVGYRKNKYSKPQLTKSLRRLREGNMIATMRATRGIIVTVLNYDTYQNPKLYEGNDEGHAKETRRKRGGHTKNKNDKNDKNDKKKQLQEKRPDFIPEKYWVELIENRKQKKLSNSDLALQTFINSLKKGVEAGYSIEVCIGEYISSKWTRFNHEWIKGDRNGTSKGRNKQYGFTEPKKPGETDWLS